MPTVFVNGFLQEVEALFGEKAVLNPSIVPFTPFTTLLITGKNIIFHLITIEKEKLSGCPTGFFSQWADAVEAKGFRAIQIAEDVWHTKQEIIHSQLISLAGKSEKIFARNTVVKRIPKPQADAFLNQWHLGGSPSSRFKYGLFLKKSGELVGVASFSPPRTFYRDGKPSRSYELIRYAGKGGVTITGGLSKIIKAFITDVQPGDIMTYADRNWWTGDSYLPLGFRMVETTAPQAFWVKLGDWHRFPEGKITEEEILAGGFVRIENSGNRKFLLSLT